MNETLTTIVGTVITDVGQRRINDGIRVASFRMASNERRFDKDSQQWVNGDSLYVTVTCWRKLALGVSASLMKGDPVIVTGRLYTRGYEVEGQKRSVTELEAFAVGPDLSRCLADVSRPKRQAVGGPPGEITDGAPETTAVATGGLVPSQHATAPQQPENHGRAETLAGSGWTPSDGGAGSGSQTAHLAAVAGR